MNRFKPKALNKSIWLIDEPQALLASGEAPSAASLPIFIHYELPVKGLATVATLLLANGEPWNTRERRPLAEVFELCGDPSGSIGIGIGSHLMDAINNTRALARGNNPVDRKVAAGRVLCAAIAETSASSDAWARLSYRAAKDRFTANVWFERDRKNVRLVDELTGIELVNLWDDAVVEAIGSGYLVAPKGRIGIDDEWDWPAALEDYARDIGLLDGFELSLPNDARSDMPAPGG